MIRINKNESPIPALDDQALKDIITSSNFNFYPDDEYDAFIQSYANYYNLLPKQISAANGSDEWIQKCMLVLEDGPVLTLNPDFFMYTAYAHQIRRPIHYVDAERDFTFSLNKILNKIKKIKPAFFIMSVPHNPSGIQYSESFLKSIADEMKAIGGYFVIDEAYLDFGDAYTIELQDHIIQMRTLSKAFAIAGLRVGIVISTEQTINKLNSIAHPYPINTLTLNIATHIFNDKNKVNTLLNQQRNLCYQLRNIFETHVSDIINVLPSKTNFVLTYGDLAKSLGNYIYENGFLPRFYDEPDMNQTVRYSIATEQQLNELENIVKNWRKTYDLSKRKIN
ncbi:aminotransferase class I/II-fold pyridoxal phosphate-dependent enzyme [Mammaliicoccus stepanovicii]|uniref:Putative pyridoxal phosphate-dependent acyltransferase n=1 Tax=Mammaliicoccus stepanovicii TaxID=643214 RepID=A0A239YSW3_9STAP|nr:histidinol-phosphate transaminase [Mammaliicoccus stepanovicii]PNZ75897.1 histidinol-phosphate aminotransferase [Mammaliicoccus stepanovicii]GGI42335.1 histidinol-phosphate aminotransferase [Mammaliicoccus stepanovicii]SNV61837.1 histidinol-phosphate aminotransferase [Mammaliicoccus stepanovicii]